MTNFQLEIPNLGRILGWLREAESVSGRQGVIIGIHGYSDHKGSFDEASRYFSAQGYDFIAFDLIGFGESEGQRAYIEDFDDYLKIIEAVHINFSEKILGQPLFFYGHSMGGMLAILYESRRLQISDSKLPEVSGLILNAPLIGLPLGLRFLNWSLPWMLHKLCSRFSFRVSIDYRGLSTQPFQVNAYANDKLRTKLMNVAFHFALSKRLKLMPRQVILPFCPVLILKSCRDSIVDPHKIDLLYSLWPHESKSIISYSRALHDMAHDAWREHLFVSINDWLKMAGKRKATKEKKIRS